MRGRRGKLIVFFRYQNVITQFQNLKIVLTEGIAFPDVLSRNVKLRELDRYQKHKKIPKDIKFFDKKGLEEKYFIVHDTERGKTNHFFPNN